MNDNRNRRKSSYERAREGRAKNNEALKELENFLHWLSVSGCVREKQRELHWSVGVIVICFPRLGKIRSFQEIVGGAVIHGGAVRRWLLSSLFWAQPNAG